HPRSISRQLATGDGAASGHGDGVDSSAVRHRGRSTGLGVKQRDQGLVRRQACRVVVREDRDELHAQAEAFSITRHRREPALVLGVDGGAGRNLDPSRAERAKASFQRFEKAIEVQQSIHLRLAQDQELHARAGSYPTRTHGLWHAQWRMKRSARGILENLVRTPSETGGEQAAAQAFAGWCEEAGMEVAMEEVEPD